MSTNYATLMPSALSASPGIQNTIREELPPTVTESLNKMDPLWAKIQSSFDQVSDQGIGRGWQILKIFNTSLAGAMNWIPTDWNSVELGKSGNAAYTVYASVPFTTANFPTYPGVDQSPNSGTLIRIIGMARGNGNMHLPVDIIKANQLSATQIDYVDKQIGATAKGVAVRQAISFYDTSNAGVLGRIASIDGTLTGANGVMLVTLASGYGRMAYIWPGMPVAIAANSAGSPDGSNIRNASYILLVDGVDAFARTVRLVSPTGDAVNGLSIAANDFLLPWGCVTSNTIYKGPYGLGDWIKSSGTLFGNPTGSTGAIDLTYYPQFKSLVKAVNGPLTEQELNADVATFYDVYDAVLDTIVTTLGVTINYLAQPSLGAGRQTYLRQGQPLDYESGFREVGYTYEGKEFTWYTSRFAPAGRLRVIKLGEGNIKRYVPPPLPRAGKEGGFPQEVEFVGPALGYNGIFVPVRDTNGNIVRMVQAPFDLLYQIAPDDVRSIELTGLDEAF